MAVPQNTAAHADTHVPQQDNLTYDFPPVFEWFENRLERSLEHVFRQDVPQRTRLLELMRDMQDSNRFEGLASAYQGAVQMAGDDTQAKHHALLAFAARIYTAGTVKQPEVMPGDMRWS